uniref:Cullin-2 n=1 Tax=Lygus hesperus TaxID=30085 RepID=A0A0A9WJ00_LYGHE
MTKIYTRWISYLRSSTERGSHEASNSTSGKYFQHYLRDEKQSKKLYILQSLIHPEKHGEYFPDLEAAIERQQRWERSSLYHKYINGQLRMDEYDSFLKSVDKILWDAAPGTEFKPLPFNETPATTATAQSTLLELFENMPEVYDETATTTPTAATATDATTTDTLTTIEQSNNSPEYSVTPPAVDTTADAVEIQSEDQRV